MVQGFAKIINFDSIQQKKIGVICLDEMYEMIFGNVVDNGLKVSLEAIFGINPDGIWLRSLVFKAGKGNKDAMDWLNLFLNNYARRGDRQEKAEVIKEEVPRQIWVICRTGMAECVFAITDPYGRIIWEALDKCGFVRPEKWVRNYTLSLTAGDCGAVNDPRNEFMVNIGDPAHNEPKKGFSHAQRLFFDSLIGIPEAMVNKP